MRRFVVLTSLVIAACSANPSVRTAPGTTAAQEPERAVVVLTHGEGPRRARMKVGDDLEVRLPTDHKAGLTWTRVSRIEGSMLTLRAGHYVEDSEAALLLENATGFETYTLRAVKPGRHRLVFEYRPPWSENGRAEKIASFRVVIRDPPADPSD